MTKWLDYFLVIALAINIVVSLMNYVPETKVLGTNIPTWVALLIQAICIGMIIYKRVKFKR